MSEWLDGCVVLASVVVRTTVEGGAKPNVTWLQTYGQLIGVAIGAVLTGAVALLLAIMNNRSSDRRLKFQQDHDLQRDRQRMTRERLEELYVLAGHWTLSLELYGFLGLRLARGQLTYADYLLLQREQANNPQVQMSRMDLLLDVYGSQEVSEAVAKVRDLRGEFNKLLTRVENLSKISGDSLTPYLTTNPVNEVLYTKIDDSVTAIVQAGRSLLETIATQIKS
ncbi:hypothetical protein N5J29_05890 [Stenotrophomonas sp. GD03680]|uniref:hypothetical protein n=1 Tax=Stenotrophomonas sp. GD03680 TaxID=2975365 RepID=UPI002447856A|nr:hypothetical protein [Stenotrophomonas sp. GD03680]MDH2022292.1 hypothetical protein [Stenotrophomonas sp. GD03680]